MICRGKKGAGHPYLYLISKTRPIQSLPRTTFMLEQGGIKQLIAIALLKQFEEKNIGERMKLLQDLVPGCNKNRQIFDKTDASGRVYGMVWVYRVGIKFSII
ncbi:hypothetical protein NC652_006138 [Populus alba x Populus x berolinensis]|nr:hypothetical protein NC652_006138 [Populus alba x Populus x berolinensis]